MKWKVKVKKKKTMIIINKMNNKINYKISLAKKSDIYLFDEPLSHLDNENKTQIINIIKNIVKNNDSTFLYVTHDINEAFKLADYVYVLDEGKLVAKCSQDELLKQNNEIVQKLLVELKNEEV